VALTSGEDATAFDGAPAERAVTNGDLERSNSRLRVLAEVSHAFATVATNYQLLLKKIARTTADLVGDGCQVTLIAADGESLYNAASAHRDPVLEADYRSYLAGIGVSKTTSSSVSATVARSGAPKLVVEIQPALLVAQVDDALKPLVARLNVHSFVVVPIRARQVVIGTLSLMRSGPGRSYSADDLTLLQDLADRAGLAIDNARLYDDLEQRVRDRTAELEIVNRELEAFSYSVAHDLRAPLRSISGFSHALLEDWGSRLDDSGRKHLARLSEAARQMGHLIDDLLELSRVSRADVRRAPVDLSRLAHVVLARLMEAEPGRPVDIAVAPGLVAEADPRLVEVVLTNLCSNAWKFTSKRHQGALIEIGAEPGDNPAPVYFVRDNGAGFDPALAARLFGAFQRLHAAREFEGTGIGLATVDRIIRRHGGRIWAEGDVDRGATFYFTLAPAPK
jgi:signal transduction histidine kinase